MDKLTLTHDIHVNGKYSFSLYGATEAQVRGALFNICADTGSEDAVAYHADTTNVADTIANYPDGDEGVEIDYQYVGGDKYPDPTDSMTFDASEEDISDLIEPDMDFDGDMVDHFYNLFPVRTVRTPADFR